MNKKNHRLEDTYIKRPCPASWEEMRGDDAGRHCESCKLTVHNLAAMSRAEGESLLTAREPESRLCVRMEFHPDGRCVTTDDPAPRPKIQPKQGGQVAAALALGAGLLAACTGDKARPDHVNQGANLSIEDGPVEHVPRGSLLGEIFVEHSTDEVNEEDRLIGELRMLGYVGDPVECDDSTPDVDQENAGAEDCEKPITTKGEVAPRPVILGSPAPPKRKQ